MSDYENETREEYLERNIAEVRTQRNILQNSSWEKVQRYDPALRRSEQLMSLELKELRNKALGENQ